MIRELDRVILNEDFPEDGLRSGDVGVVVLVHQGGKGFEVEFVALNGETEAVITVNADQVRSIRPHELVHARSMEMPLAA